MCVSVTQCYLLISIMCSRFYLHKVYFTIISFLFLFMFAPHLFRVLLIISQLWSVFTTYILFSLVINRTESILPGCLFLCFFIYLCCFLACESGPGSTFDFGLSIRDESLFSSYSLVSCLSVTYLGSSRYTHTQPIFHPFGRLQLRRKSSCPSIGRSVVRLRFPQATC